MNLLSEEDKLLYDSCETFAETYVKMKISANIHITNYGKSPFLFLFKDFMCFGDSNIQELCNRCPLYITKESYKDLIKTHNSQD